MRYDPEMAARMVQAALAKAALAGQAASESPAGRLALEASRLQLASAPALLEQARRQAAAQAAQRAIADLSGFHRAGTDTGVSKMADVEGALAAQRVGLSAAGIPLPASSLAIARAATAPRQAPAPAEPGALRQSPNPLASAQANALRESARAQALRRQLAERTISSAGPYNGMMPEPLLRQLLSLLGGA